MAPTWTRQSYTPRDTILYALGVGAGIQPELQYVYEDGLHALPTMAVTLASPGFWLQAPEHEVDWRKIVHGEQGLIVHRRLAAAGAVRSKMTIDDIFDKGAEKGAVICTTRRLYDETDGALIATMRESLFLRGDGGRGGRTAPPATRPSGAFDGPPHTVVDLQTRPEQALIYRLAGDFNPLHADPVAAAAAGFSRPILHGLCTYGLAYRAVSMVLEAQGVRLSRFDVRFSSPVYPGETIRTEIWASSSRAEFRARVLERDEVVLTNGIAEFN